MYVPQDFRLPIADEIGVFDEVRRYQPLLKEVDRAQRLAVRGSLPELSSWRDHRKQEHDRVALPVGHIIVFRDV